MRILGTDLQRREPERGGRPGTLVMLEENGKIARVTASQGLAALVSEVGQLAGGEPFLLGVNFPVVVPDKPVKSRPVENLVKRRLGFKLPPGGRGSAVHLSGESLLAALAGAGHPCLTYPDRNLRSSGLAEIRPGLVLKTLMWSGSLLAHTNRPEAREELFKAYGPPVYKKGTGRSRSKWQERAAAIDLILRSLEKLPGYDFSPVREALAAAASEEEMDTTASILDAVLIAGTALRYLESPEGCAFIGDRENGYTIVPADGFIRRLALSDSGPRRRQLFPKESLRDRLEAVADIRSLDLLAVRGKPQRLEAVFKQPPVYEFDNLDEMLWWKHCRHLDGPAMPTEGLSDMVVELGGGSGDGSKPLHLIRSRHRTLSFRFDPPGTWRTRISTRDGKVYSFKVLRATYETLPSS